MSEKGKKLEPALHLDMDFGEALERFARTKPQEVADSIERSKQKKPPGAMAPGGLEEIQRGVPPKGRRRKPSEGA
jgi:hypothetical protein